MSVQVCYREAYNHIIISPEYPLLVSLHGPSSPEALGSAFGQSLSLARLHLLRASILAAADGSSCACACNKKKTCMIVRSPYHQIQSYYYSSSKKKTHLLWCSMSSSSFFLTAIKSPHWSSFTDSCFSCGTCNCDDLYPLQYMSSEP